LGRPDARGWERKMSGEEIKAVGGYVKTIK
jgi:hypothetical protein